MNGTSRLYRSTSEAMIGGVAAGLGNYFKVDPTIVRFIFLVLTFLSGGAFIFVYLAFWLLLPTPASTATTPGDVVRENVNDLGNRVRSFTGGMSTGGTTVSNPGNGQPAATNGQPVASNGAPQLPPAGPVARHRQGISPQALIAIGVFFLLINMGIFHAIHWSFWWPLLLIGLGVIMLTRRNV
jgi:phage shock protein PspC (stress-responsive transcriptional regulator)